MKFNTAWALAAWGLAAGAASAATLGIGDPAPPLQIDKWINTSPIEIDTKGDKAYLFEFWATWCGPCIMSMPHLNEIHHKYEDELVVLAISDEPEAVVRRFVKDMPKKVDYPMAVDKAQQTTRAYLAASGQMGIPVAFIVNKQGRVAWLGHPMDPGMDAVLDAVIKGTYDIDQAKAEMAKAQAEMAADERFMMAHRLELITAMQQADWPTAARLARQVADPASGVSKSLRLEVLVQVSWSMLTHEKADKAYVKDALQLAKAAYDLGRENALVVDTYARALFEDGRIQDAIEHQREAIELADEAGLKKELQNTLSEYEAALK